MTMAEAEESRKDQVSSEAEADGALAKCRAPTPRTGSPKEGTSTLGDIEGLHLLPIGGPISYLFVFFCCKNVTKS